MFQSVQLVIGYFCRCIAAVLERPWHPESVHFIHPAPDDIRAWRRIFACPVDFHAPFNGFVCANEALVEPNPASDAGMVEHAERLLKFLTPGPSAPAATDRVRQSLRLLLPEQRGTIEQVAGNLGVTPRSLQRLLEREGTSFGAVLNQARRAVAQRLLSTPQEVGNVAAMSGFARPSSFTRWFRAEFGMSPSEWRRQAVGRS
jgi:AraC-like DNA-binding protein